MNKKEKRREIRKASKENKYEEFMRGRSHKKGNSENVKKQRSTKWDENSASESE